MSLNEPNQSPEDKSNKLAVMIIVAMGFIFVLSMMFSRACK
jgi:hypothetical protein